MGELDLIRHRYKDGTIYCDVCREMRPDTEYLGLGYDVGSGGLMGGSADEHPIACKRCRTVGPPKIDHLSALTKPELRAIEALTNGLDVKGASKASGIPQRRLNDMLRGRNAKHFRRAWQHILESEGLTMTKLAKKAAALIEAKDHKWNPVEESFTEFEDARTQLATAKWIATQHQADPPKETAEKQGLQAMQVVINTNLGQNADGRSIDADYILKATQIPVEKDEEAESG
jgi:hypothetical protein